MNVVSIVGETSNIFLPTIERITGNGREKDSRNFLRNRNESENDVHLLIPLYRPLEEN